MSVSSWRPAAQVIDEAEPGRRGRQLVLGQVDHRGEHVVDGVEVRPHRGQALGAAGQRRRRDPEVEVDVRVHPQQEVLQDDRSPRPRRGERRRPRSRRRPPGPPLLVRGEVAVGERADEVLHPRRLDEPTVLAAGTDSRGDPLVHAGEQPDAVAFLP